MKRVLFIISAFIISVFYLFYSGTANSYVTKEGNKTYIVDQTGEKWDVNQAKSIGFDPHKFQYGIGRNAFTTLSDMHLKNRPSFLTDYRIIGIANESEAQAYSVSKLRGHEIANTALGSKSIVVGY